MHSAICPHTTCEAHQRYASSPIL